MAFFFFFLSLPRCNLNCVKREKCEIQTGNCDPLSTEHFRPWNAHLKFTTPGANVNVLDPARGVPSLTFVLAHASDISSVCFVLGRTWPYKEKVKTTSENKMR